MKKVYVTTSHKMTYGIVETKVSIIVETERATLRTKVLTVTGTSVQQNKEIENIVEELKRILVDTMAY